VSVSPLEIQVLGHRCALGPKAQFGYRLKLVQTS